VADRFLREALLKSDLFNTLTVEARDLFVRLLLVVDDFGCYDGRDHIIATACFPHKHQDCSTVIRELQQAGLIVRYSNRGKGYIAIMQWGELLRKLPRKFPAPPVNNDKENIKYRGPYNRPMEWGNPEGCDDVSVLIDDLGRAVVPQPPEWRREGDLMPLDCELPQQGDLKAALKPIYAKASSKARAARVATSLRSPPAAPPVSLGHQGQAPTAAAAVAVAATPTATVAAAAAAAVVQAAPSLVARVEEKPRLAATATANGSVKLLDSGEWHGVSEAQRLRWQEMFAEMSIPDQLDRAGAWLLAHPEQRQQYERSDDGLQAFLIRWLLREARGTGAPAP
jgi:hypothetical protein